MQIKKILMGGITVALATGLVGCGRQPDSVVRGIELEMHKSSDDTSTRTTSAGMDFWGTFDGVDFTDGIPVEDFDKDGEGRVAYDVYGMNDDFSGELVYVLNDDGEVWAYNLPASVEMDATWRGCTFDSTKKEIRRAYKGCHITEDDRGLFIVSDDGGAKAIRFVFEECGGEEVLTNVYTSMVVQ